MALITALQAIVLGIIQGLSEFLPISSDGHLVLFQKLLGFEGGSLVFNVILHIGTLGAVIIFYFKDLLKMFHWSFVKLGIVSSVPTAVIALVIKKVFDFENVDLRVVGIFFAISGAFLYFANRKMKVGAPAPVELALVTEQISYKKAFWIGVAQGFAVLPGLSRSGSTIATGLMMGCTAPIAAFYSFAISIPAIIGACILELPEAQVDPADIPYYIVGTGISFLVGVGALWFLKYVFSKKAALAYFSYYLWALALIMFVI